MELASQPRDGGDCMIKREDSVGRKTSTTSMLKAYPVIYDTSDGVRFLNVYRGLDVSAQLSSSFIYTDYMVQEDDWFDLISYKAYENVNLWWVVPITNEKVNPFEDIETGEIVKVLNGRYMYVIYDDLFSIGEL